MRTAFLSLALAATSLAAEPQTSPVMAIGSPVPDFALPGIDGKTHKLAHFSSAKVLCLVFTCNHCPDAIAAAGRIQQLHLDYKDKQVAVVAINSSSPLGLRPDELGYGPHGDTFEEMTPFAEDHGWTLPYLYDGETQTLSATCGAQTTPHVFVFGSDRKLAYTGRMDDAARKSGPVDKSYVKDAIEALLAGKPPETTVTRSFGCSTKWAWKKDQVAADQKAWEAKPVGLDKLDLATARKLRANAGGNVRLINFWSTTCGPCVAEFPALVDTYRRFQNRSFDLVTISLDPTEDEAKVRKFLEKHHAALSERTRPALAKEERAGNNYLFVGENIDQLAEAIDPQWTGAQPYTLLVSPKGEILWRSNQEIEPVELRRQIAKALEDLP